MENHTEAPPTPAHTELTSKWFTERFTPHESHSHELKNTLIQTRTQLQETDEQFDIIISDLPTPIEGGPAYQLYTLEFYRKMLQRLRPKGIFIAQAGSGSLVQYHFHSVLANTLKKLFKVIRPFYAFVPS